MSDGLSLRTLRKRVISDDSVHENAKGKLRYLRGDTTSVGVPRGVSTRRGVPLPAEISPDLNPIGQVAVLSAP
jgi:hypothetical protein